MKRCRFRLLAAFVPMGLILAFTIAGNAHAQITTDATRAEIANDPEAGVNLAINTIGDAQYDYARAIGILESRPDSGDPIAQQALAEVILRWREKHPQQASDLYTAKYAEELYLSAASKSRPIMVYLQILYHTGARGFPKDRTISSCISKIYNSNDPKESMYSCVNR